MKASWLALAALSATLAAPATARAQAPGSPEQALARAERLAAGLRQGMSSDDVRKLLGPPLRSALRSEGTSRSEVANSRLQWTYTWQGASGAGTLRVDFTSKSTDAWAVSSWQWGPY